MPPTPRTRSPAISDTTNAGMGMPLLVFVAIYLKQRLIFRHLNKATVRKMKQNLFWASSYNILAIPIAAGVLYPSYGILLRPEISALLMSASSIIVATNAVLLKRAEKSLVAV